MTPHEQAKALFDKLEDINPLAFKDQRQVALALIAAALRPRAMEWTINSDDLDPVEAAKRLLIASDLVYGVLDDCPDGNQVLNMNDTWGWATGWGEKVPDSELLEVARLIRKYGFCGALYWVSERHNHMRSEFEDINRFVEFVRNEEAIRNEIQGSTGLAYAKRSYTIGSGPLVPPTPPQEGA